MASVSKRGDRQWQAKVRRKGHSASATFETKARAEAWARQIESDIDAGRFHPGRLEAEKVTLAEALEGLHFHDLRHEATSRLFERTDLRDIEIASITGHKTMEMLKRYAHLRAGDLADRLG